MLTSSEKFTKTKFNSFSFYCKQRILVKSVSVTKSHAHLYAKIVNSGEKKSKIQTNPKNVLYLVPLQKLHFVENLFALLALDPCTSSEHDTFCNRTILHRTCVGIERPGQGRES